MKVLGYSPRTLAKLLNISPNHVYALIMRGELKAVRLGRRIIIPRHELERIGVVLPPKGGDNEMDDEA